MPARLTQVSSVLLRVDVAGHQVHRHLQPVAQHAQRIGDAALLVDDELLRDGVQDLAVRRQRRRLRRLEHPSMSWRVISRSLRATETMPRELTLRMSLPAMPT